MTLKFCPLGRTRGAAADRGHHGIRASYRPFPIFSRELCMSLPVAKITSSKVPPTLISTRAAVQHLHLHLLLHLLLHLHLHLPWWGCGSPHLEADSDSRRLGCGSWGATNQRREPGKAGSNVPPSRSPHVAWGAHLVLPPSRLSLTTPSCHSAPQNFHYPRGCRAWL